MLPLEEKNYRRTQYAKARSGGGAKSGGVAHAGGGEDYGGVLPSLPEGLETVQAGAWSPQPNSPANPLGDGATAAAALAAAAAVSRSWRPHAPAALGWRSR